MASLSSVYLSWHTDDHIEVIGRRMKFFLCVLGMVMIFEGLPYFAFPAKMKAVIRKVLELPASNLRAFGFVLMFLGLGLIYLGKS